MVLTGRQSGYAQAYMHAQNPIKRIVGTNSATRLERGSGLYYQRCPQSITVEAAGQILPTIWGDGFADAVMSARMAELVDIRRLLAIDKNGVIVYTIG